MAKAPEILQEMISLHSRVLLRMPIIAVLVIGAVALQAMDHLPPQEFAIWAALLFGIELIRAFFARSLSTGRFDARGKHVHLTLIVLAGCAGFAVGLSGFWFFPYLPVEKQALLTVVYFGMSAGGVAVSASSQAILSAYSISMLAPVTLAWAIAHPEQAGSISFLASLYCVFLILVAGDGERLLGRSILIRRERDRVVRDLEVRNGELQAARAVAEQSATTRARVLAAASHDLRQPLHALSIYSAILSAKPDPASLPEVARSIDQLVRALGNLLNGLLDLSRLSSGHYVPQRVSFELDRLVADVIAESRVAIDEKGLVLAVQLSPVRVHSDPTGVGRIVRNLLDNAVKYTDTGVITVRVEQVESRARISVADTGKGIPPEEHERIFEEFYQLDNAGRDRSKGVGLGLAIVKRLCELLDAEIGIRSDPASAHGVRFEVFLPIPGRPVAIREVDSPCRTEPQLAGQSVYVIDDEPEIRRSMQSLLTIWELEVRTASGASELEALFEGHGPPDLLIVDLRLGGDENGAALARRLIGDRSDVAVLVVTGETSSATIREASSEGFAMLAKPIAPEALLRAIVDALGRRRN